jgi:hypothetical protein
MGEDPGIKKQGRKRIASTVEKARLIPLTGGFSQLQAKNSVNYLNLRNVISVIQT